MTKTMAMGSEHVGNGPKAQGSWLKARLMPMLAIILVLSLSLGIAYAIEEKIVEYNVVIVPLKDGDVQKIDVSVFQFTTTQQGKSNEEAQRDFTRYITRYAADGRENAVNDAEAALKVAVANTDVELATKGPDDRVYITYRKGADWAPIEGDCGGKNGMPLSLLIPDAVDVQGRTTPVYHNTCVIPREEVYKDTCTSVRAVYNSERGAETSSIRICDKQVRSLTYFSDTLRETLLTADYNKMILAIATIGLLLATLYFSGRSPISLLDITTPRLPSPKTLAASGQILGPFGYTEMKKTTTDKINAGLEALGAGSSLMRHGAGAFAGRVDSLVGNIPKSMSWADKRVLGEEKQAKQFATALGLSVANISDPGLRAKWIREIEPLISKHQYKWGEGDHATFARAMRDIEGDAIKHNKARMELNANVLKDIYAGKEQYKRLEVLTAHSDVGQRRPGVQLVQTAIGMTASPGRFKWLGPLLTGGFDSTMRTIPVGGRFLKATAGEVMRAVGGAAFVRAIEEREAKKAAATGQQRVESALLAASPGRVKVGGISPIADKMAAMYNALHEEAYRDIARYTIAQIFKKQGVRFDLSMEEMMHLGYKEVDVLHMTNLTPKALAALERMEEQMKAILASDMSVLKKTEAMMEFARNQGVSLDAKINNEMRKLEAMQNEKVETHVKLISMYEYLTAHHEAEKGAPTGNEFRYNIGKEIQPHNAFSTFTLGKYMHDAEHGALAGTIKDVLLFTQLHFMNRMVSLNPDNRVYDMAAPMHLPEFMRKHDAEVKGTKDRATRIMKELFDTETGRELYAKLKKENPNKSEFELYFKMLYGGPSTTFERKVKETKVGGYGVQVDEASKRVLWWEEDKEFGPKRGAAKVDIKGHWLDGLSDRESFALGQWVENRFTRSYIAPQKASIDRELQEKYGKDVHTWRPEDERKHGREVTMYSKELWVKEHLVKDLGNYVSSIYSTEAFRAHLDVPVYAKFAQGVLALALRENGKEHIAAEAEKLNINEKSDAKKLKEMLTDYNAIFQARLMKPVLYDDVSHGKQPWVVTYEGGMVPYVPGMQLSDYDRMVGGYLAFKDEHGKWKRFDPNQQIDFQSKGATHLQTWFKALHSEPDPNRSIRMPDGREINWTTLRSAVKEWAAGQGAEGKRMAAIVDYRYANATNDWSQAMDNVRVVSKRDAAPLSPQGWRYFSDKEFPLMGKLTPIRDRMLGFGDAISRIAFATGGPVHQASWEITPFSEYYKLQSWRMAEKIMTTKWNDVLGDVSDPQLRKEMRAAYEGVALSHSAYHQVWDYAIDRNPWATSKSFGQHQAWGGFFHFGPAQQYPLENNLRTLTTAGEWRTFMAQYGWPMKLARVVFTPYTMMFRGMQMSMQGYASRWDKIENAMKPWNYTEPRMMEWLGAMNPLTAYEKFQLPSWKGIPKKIGQYDLAGKWVDVSEFNLANSAAKLVGKEVPESTFKGSLAQRHLAGREFARGLAVTPQDIWYVREGVYASARTGAANPGSSYYDYRFMLHLDPLMAETLAYRAHGGGSSSYFKKDPYVRAQAMKPTVKREVGGEYLQARREEELRGFGFLQNPVYAWLGPAFFMWHSGLGFLTPFVPHGSPKDIVFNLAQKVKRKEGIHFGETIRNSGARLGQGTMRVMQPWRTSQVAYCGVCMTSGYRGSICRGCQSRESVRVL